MSETDYTPDEMMTIAAARRLRNGTVCFVGIGLPSAAANLARLTHAPDVVLIYESGTIGARPEVLPLSIGDGELAETADTVVSVPEIFSYWLQAGRVDVGFLGAAQIDRFGNINSTLIGGDYRQPKVRLPGAGGASEIATGAREIVIVLRQSTRTCVAELDFVTSSGYRLDNGGRGRKATTIISDLGVMTADPETRELVLQSVFAGVTTAQAMAATGWPLRVASEVPLMEPPTADELRALRDLQARTAAAHGRPSAEGK